MASSTTPTKSAKICGQCRLSESEAQPGILRICGRCRSVYYCSTDCQRAAYPEHKKICLSFKAKGTPSSEAKETNSRSQMPAQHLPHYLSERMRELTELEGLIARVPRGVMDTEKNEVANMRQRLTRNDPNDSSKEVLSADFFRIHQIVGEIMKNSLRGL